MPREIPGRNAFMTNARSGLGLWENIEGSNGNSRLVRYSLTAEGKNYLTSMGVKFPDLLRYESFQDLIKEKELLPKHYLSESSPILVREMSPRHRRHIASL